VTVAANVPSQATGASDFGELRAGNLGVRIATTAAEIDAVQAMRYRIFYEEMGAKADPAMAASRRDSDDYDAVADHLLVVDHAIGPGPEGVVGTYRLIPREAADKIGRFYSASEYDITPMATYPGRVLELGRSCVAADYRNRAVMQLLWRGIAAYIFRHKIDLMFGCASLPGNDVSEMALPLSYLHHFHPMPQDIRVTARPELATRMDVLAKDSFDPREALRTLPPLLKGYVRAGCMIGEGAVIDRQFCTTDVFIYFPISTMDARYKSRFGLVK